MHLKTVWRILGAPLEPRGRAGDPKGSKGTSRSLEWIPKKALVEAMESQMGANSGQMGSRQRHKNIYYIYIYVYLHS